MMLDYDWGNPSSIFISGDDEEQPTQESDQNPQMFNNYNQTFAGNNMMSQGNTFSNFNYFQLQEQQQQQSYAALSYPPPTPMMALTPESETFYSPRIGLNLGGRTYFSNDDSKQLYRRSRQVECGWTTTSIPRCQAEDCNADLTNSKQYHRRHKVCEYHSKAETVVTKGLTQRFHVLSEFDQGKKSCRKRLAEHNRRRRKNNSPSTSQTQRQQQYQLNDTARSSSESGANSMSSSATVAISPPRMLMEWLGRRQNNSDNNNLVLGSSTSPSSSSFFLSSMMGNVRSYEP
ncbi:hypothetical protein GIB67_001181 [Kingdonia uniflora]|uniref:SBP-type domain-containing protein n=1 Tax=Kingdonia uniflora TaxID=39325 RepID=A0A7J7LGG6_9MAGN|nr:hypothetical protein GIB67_001181 [Kingdonia uniflora]